MTFSREGSNLDLVKSVTPGCGLLGLLKAPKCVFYLLRGLNRAVASVAPIIIELDYCSSCVCQSSFEDRSSWMFMWFKKRSVSQERLVRGPSAREAEKMERSSETSDAALHVFIAAVLTLPINGL